MEYYSEIYKITATKSDKLMENTPDQIRTGVAGSKVLHD